MLKALPAHWQAQHGYRPRLAETFTDIDDKRRGPNVVETLGAMNLIDPLRHRDEPKGLFLIGGPSQHDGWDAPKLVEQIENILAATPGIQWSLTYPLPWTKPNESSESSLRSFSKPLIPYPVSRIPYEDHPNST
ncbi:MAG: hypothetical protein GVY36_15645 [Verrucomicrobia bacterium]|jgi:uncharacterized protein (DUF2461 family)|nr:hypothetical protein [Verrucomicrobiota bacterium]